MPEYNSDDSDDESSKPVEKPLFPSSSSANTALNQPIKSIELSKDVNSDQRSQSPKSDQKLDAAPKKKQSFASIITGGRSPQHETVDIQQFIGDDQSDELSNQCDEVSNETENLSQKTFQRKRRIEFKVSGVPAKRSNQNGESNENAAAAGGGGGGDTESAKDIPSTIASAKAKYSNFQKGETEFVESQSTNSNDVGNAKHTSTKIDEMTDEQQILEAKLNFLCQGRADVSPVQIIQIQLQVSNEYEIFKSNKTAYRSLGSMTHKRNYLLKSIFCGQFKFSLKKIWFTSVCKLLSNCIICMY